LFKIHILNQVAPITKTMLIVNIFQRLIYIPMKLIFTHLLVLISFVLIHGQTATIYPENNLPPILTQIDEVVLRSLPEARIPDNLRSRELPWHHDNSIQPYLRPIFSQSGPSCGQSAGVGYGFTYEINRLRDLPADTSINQYPSHFTYNFMNGGSGYYGVNYMHSFEILRLLGTPNVKDYGGMSIDNGEIWVSGYDLYYSAMKNRIRGVKAIKVNTPEGLHTLKHWLVNHLEGSEIGGIANFNAGSPWNLETLPPESPEAGKNVMVQFPGTYATHAMTIMGYNDSIRFDYNNDGQFTNHLDINDDGQVDIRDWEIGGVKFANSYGSSWGDEGFCYMMYKVLADDVTIGGIWNSTVHIIEAKAFHEPLLTMKLTLKHDSREKIRVAAGVATDTSRLIPEHLIYYQVFNFQGGHNYMQGGRTNPDHKIIEFGLDISPLLSHIEPGQPVKFFIEITENDPKNTGAGEIISFSIIDYTDGMVEIPCPQTSVPIADDDVTYLSVVHTVPFDKVEIVTEELPAATPGQNFEYQLEAAGGSPGYRWEIKTPYHQQLKNADFPLIDDVQLIPEAPHYKLASQEIGFEFPFYGKKYSKIYLHRDGYLLFEENDFPWSYYNDAFVLFRQMKCIAGFMFYPVSYYPGTHRDERFWYEGDETVAAFRWNKALTHHEQTVGHAEFAVKLYPDGRIEYYFNGIELTEDILWYTGVSQGLNKDHTLIENANSSRLPAFTAYSLSPEIIPENIQLSAEGLISGIVDPTESISDITVKVADEHEISTTKTLQLSDRFIFSYQLNALNTGILHSGDTVTIDLTVKNISTQVSIGVEASLLCKDQHFELVSGNASLGDIQPGGSVTVQEAFKGVISVQCPDQYIFTADLQISSGQIHRNGKIHFGNNAPVLNLKDYLVDDNDNNRLDPGETTNLLISLANFGNAAATGITGTLTCNDPFITINNPATVDYGCFLPGQTGQQSFSVSVDAACPIFHEVKFFLTIDTEIGQQFIASISLNVGQYPLMVVNLAKNEVSANVIKSSLDALGIDYDYNDSIPERPDLYRAIILCLGTFYFNTALTQAQGAVLSDFLDNGGRLYMEGTTTWYIDPQTPVHPKFSTSVITIPNWISFTSMLGVEGNFAQGLNFPFTGTYNLLPCYFQPYSPGLALMRINTGDNNVMMSSCDAGNYKTVGSILEFGSFGNDASTADRNALMYEILKFFGLQDYIISVPEPEEAKIPGVISFSPNPFNDEIHFQISLEKSGPVEITIYDINGREIWQVIENATAGKQTITVKPVTQSGNLLPASVYFFRITGNEWTTSGKIIQSN